MILDYIGGPNVLIRIPLRGKQVRGVTETEGDNDSRSRGV